MSDLAALDPPSARPLWLMTLADLALLLLGFMVLVHSLQPPRRDALVRELRQRFAGMPTARLAPAPRPAPMPLASAEALDFAPGSATPPASATPLIAWARAAARDPRVSLTVSGASDGSSADVDPVTRSGPLLAADRARAVGTMLVAAQAIAPDRLILTTTAPRRRAVTVTLAFTGASPP